MQFSYSSRIVVGAPNKFYRFMNYTRLLVALV